MKWFLVLALLGCGSDPDTNPCGDEPASCIEGAAHNCTNDCKDDDCKAVQTRFDCAAGAACVVRKDASNRDVAHCFAFPSDSCDPATADPVRCRGDGAAETCEAQYEQIELYDCTDSDPGAPGCDVCGA